MCVSVQVGRAGRDGTEARCYVLLDNNDYLKLRSLVYKESCELASTAAFLAKVGGGVL